jgi:hypothetical protein
MLRIHTSEPLLQLKLAVAHSRSRKPFFTYSVRRCSSTSMLSFARSSMTPVFLAARGYILLLPSETHHCYPLLILHLHIIEPSQHLLRGILCIHRTAALRLASCCRCTCWRWASRVAFNSSCCCWISRWPCRNSSKARKICVLEESPPQTPTIVPARTSSSLWLLRAALVERSLKAGQQRAQISLTLAPSCLVGP